MYHIIPERFQFGYCRCNDPEKAWSYTQNSYLNSWQVSSNFHSGFSRKHGTHMRTLLIMALYFGLSRMWLSKCTWAYKNIIQLNVLTIFLYKFISEASKCHMCKFYQIASNSLQAIQIVHKLFDCPSYLSREEVRSYILVLPSSCIKILT